MKKIIEILKDLGLEEKEIKIYLAALEGSPCSVIDLSKRTEMERTSIYNFINGMIQKGIIVPTAIGNKFLYSAAQPEELVNLLDKKKERLLEILPELALMFTKSGSKKPKIRFYEGAEGIKKIYYNLIEEKGGELLFYSSVETMYKELSTTFWDNWIKKKVKSGIPSRGISPSDQFVTGNYSMDVNKKALRDLITVSEKEFPIKNEIMVYKNKMTLVSFGEEKMGVLIESEQIADTQRAIFDLLWNNLKRGRK